METRITNPAVQMLWQQYFGLKMGSTGRLAWIDNAAYVVSVQPSDLSQPEPAGFMVAT